jgi:signal transduction histidine kinase
MALGGSSFRVLRGGGSQVPGDPGFVIYRLDPATLAFTEVCGNPEQLLGFPPRDWFRTRFWSGRLHPEDREAACAFFRGWASAWRDEQLEYRVIDATGRTVWVHQIICVERDTRQEVTICGVLIDVTERVAREADVETTLFLKSELFRMIVEELGPPVRAISIYGDMLGRHLSAQGDDVGSDYAVGLRDGLERLDTTLAQLMRLVQSGGASADQMNGGLGALHRGNPVG